MVFFYFPEFPGCSGMFRVPGFIDGRWNLAFDSERNTSTLSEFIGYAELTDFREFLPKHSRDTEKRKRVGKFWYLTYFLFLILGEKIAEGKKSWQCKQTPHPFSSSSGSVTVSKEDQYFLCFKTYRCNYCARHRRSLVNICSYRNQPHLDTVLGHDRNKTLIDTRQYL